MPHVDDARLHAYLDGELGWLDENPLVLERHLERCADCQARLEEAKRLREHGRSLLGSYLPVERPPFEAVLRRARGGSEQSAARRRVPTAVWAASLVLALAGGWLARGMLGVGPSAPGGESVQLSSAPVPASPPATAQTDTGQGPPPPAPSAAEPTPPSEPIVEAATLPGSAEPAALALEIPPVAQRVEAEPPPAQIAPRSEEGGRIGMIEGRVTDESGRVIPGAVIQVRGLGLGTLTRPDGTYSLAMPAEMAGINDGLVLTARAIGWEAAAQPLSPADDHAVTRDFRLRPAQVALEAIVVVGYGSASRTREAESGEQAGDAGWTAAVRGEIRRLLGRDALRIAGMRVLDTAIGRVDGIRTVRVRQELPGGAVATLLQWADLRGGDAFSGAVAVAGRSPSRGSLHGTEAEATAWRDGVRIVARAPLAADSLAMLLERLE
jgi:hypothetical protein